MKHLQENRKGQNMELEKIKVNNKEVELVRLLIALLIKKGKRQFIEKKIFDLLRVVKKEHKITGAVFLDKCVSNARPYVGFFSKKVGKQTHNIPVGLSHHKEISLALQWLTTSNCGIKQGNLFKILHRELEAGYAGRGKAIQKRISQHNLADKNRVYLKHM